ncbi:MAG: enoyl-CoA hydratase/isomerase family protein [Pseudomonadales bacterium]|nr:enoyl-CoA hydratase/isomerase family protein [Pseudomonadales bacterium]MDG1442840.1 enoyl-CoA hydratase/isomerase family protein [Pseudomonadales bacterium]
MSLVKLEKTGNVFTLTMDAGENRWNTALVDELIAALDEVEQNKGATALVTTGASEKFYSNGLDLDWRNSPDNFPEAGDPDSFHFMEFMARMITLSVPTIAAVNGHAFGAGFMFALCHDYRIMREDRGYMCANEIQLGMIIPAAELSLFRHKLPAHVFYESVQLARRWGGPHARDAGVVNDVASMDELLKKAVAKGEELAPLAENRKQFAIQKENIFGENSILNDTNGAAFHLRTKARYPK